MPPIVVALFKYTSQNYYEDIEGKWECDPKDRYSLENEPIYFLEFKKDGTLIWDNGRKTESYHYKIKRKYIYIEGIKKFKISELLGKSSLWIVECNSKKLNKRRINLNRCRWI